MAQLSAFIVAALLLISTANAYPPQQSQAASDGQSLTPAEGDAISRCDAPNAIQETVQCWMANEDGKWLTGPDVLDAQSALNNADWEQFVDTAFRGERNVTKALNRVFQSTGGVSSVMLGFALQADDAIYGDSAPETRGKMCRALQALMDCVSKHAGARCQDVVNTRLDRLPMRFGLTGFSLPPTAKFDSVLQMGAKVLCYICNEADQREGLKVLLSTALDGNKRKQTADLMKSQNRLNVYRQCPSASKQSSTSPRTQDDFLQLLKDSPCDFYPYFHCLANDVQAQVNPGVDFNVLDGIGNITFNHLFSCNDATVPNSGPCKQVDDIKAQFKSGGALPTGRSSAADGSKPSGSQPNAAAAATVSGRSFFTVVLVTILSLAIM